MADITLVKPQAGSTQTLPPQAEDRLILDFKATEATLTREGDDLIMSFNDEAMLTLSDFYMAYTSENMPSFIVEGTEISGEEFFAALGEELMPAMGEASTQLLSSGNRVDTISVSLQGGIDSLNGLDQAYVASTSKLSEAQNVIAARATTRAQNATTLTQNASDEEQQTGNESVELIPPKISVTINDDDDVISKDDLAGPNGNQVEVTVTLEEGVEEGDEIIIEQNGEIIFKGPVTDSMLEDGLTIWVDPPLEGDLNIEATVTTEEGLTDTDTSTAIVDVAPPEAGISIDSITEDNVINAAEAGKDVTITGTVGKDVQPGDTVTLTVGGQSFTGTVDSNLEYAIDVPGSLLVKNDNIEASVTITDAAGNSTTARTDTDYEVDTDIGGNLDGTVTSYDDNMAINVEVDGITLPDDVSYNFEGALSVGDADNPFGVFYVDNSGNLVFTQDEAYQHDRNSDSDTQEVQIPVKDAAGNESFVTVTVTVVDSAPEISKDSDTELTADDNIATGQIEVDFGGDIDGASITMSGGGTLSYGATFNAESGRWEAIPPSANDNNPLTVETSYENGIHTIKIGDVTMTSTDNQNWDISYEHNDSTRDLNLKFTDGDGDFVNHTLETKIDTQLSAELTIDSITDDNIINAAEAGEEITITGTVGKDVKYGDTVTLTVGEQTFTGTVDNNLEYAIDVPGSLLAENSNIEASVTITDAEGNTTTAKDTNHYTVDTQISGATDGTVTSYDDNMVINVEVESVTLPEDASYNFGDKLVLGDAETPFGTFTTDEAGNLFFTQNNAYQHDKNSDSGTRQVQIPIKDTAGNESFVTVTITVVDSAPEVSKDSKDTLIVVGNEAKGQISVDFGGDMNGAVIALKGGATVDYGATWNAKDGIWMANPPESWDKNPLHVETSYENGVHTIIIGDVTLTSTDNVNWDASYTHNDSDRELEFRFTDGDGDRTTHIMETNDASSTINLGAENDYVRIDETIAADATNSTIINTGEGDDIVSSVNFTEAARAYLNGGEGYDAFIYETEGDCYIDFSQAGSISIGAASGVDIEGFESLTTGSGNDIINVGSNTDAHVDSGLGFDIVVADSSMTESDMSEILQNSLNTEMFIFSNDTDVTGATSTEEAINSLKGVEKSENGDFILGDNWTQGESSTYNGTEFQSFTDEASETTIMITKTILETTNT